MKRDNWPIGALALVGLALAVACTAAAPAAGPGAKSSSAPPASTAPAASGPPAAGAAPAATAPQAPVRLVLGHIPATHSGGMYIAQERGYFAEQGIEAELVPFPSLTDAVVPLTSGQMDAYAGGSGANLYNAIARGLGLRAVADKAHSEPGVKYKGFVARKDLWDSGEIRQVADLRGRPVASLPSGGGVEYQIEKVLQTANMTMDDIQYKGMSIPDQLVALTNRAVDAAWLFQPALCTAERRNLGMTMLPLLDDVAPGLQGGVVTYSESFIRDKPQAARSLMVAYVKAIRAYNGAQLYNVDRPQIVEILQKYVNLPDVGYYDDCEWGRISPDGRVDRRWVEDEMVWSVKTGLMDRVLPVEQVVDDTYVDYALQLLGPYRPPAP